MYYMELALGQYGGEAPLTIFSCVPIAKGVGAAMVMVSLIVAIYYNVIMSYTLYYMFASMQKVLPWTTCNNEWNTKYCYVRGENITYFTNLIANTSLTLKTAAEEYYNNKVLGANVIEDGVQVSSYNIANLGPIKWDVVLCLLLSWIVVFACLMKGIKSSGKVCAPWVCLPPVGVLIYVLMSLHTKIDENAELIEQDLEPLNEKELIIKDNVIGTMV
ncbi:PREDICTED: sodium-dependent proline transporter-like [Priapulus caudatus]|uniref:Sodium-dependent proline transporter-like n=1 Tax=Priapulus caudatus TaxID=37621 RepID=A0ABM1DRZ2_PRICU|nr:PREDICTED: sodium-dependent proline transporter-like [Priapulus caudatus]